MTCSVCKKEVDKPKFVLLVRDKGQFACCDSCAKEKYGEIKKYSGMLRIFSRNTELMEFLKALFE